MDKQMNTSYFKLILNASQIAIRCFGLEATCCQLASQLFPLRHFGQTFRATAWLSAPRNIADWGEELTVPPDQLWIPSCHQSSTNHKTSPQIHPGRWALPWASRISEPWCAPWRVILMTWNCNGLKLVPAVDKELFRFPQNSVGSRMKPQDHVVPAVTLRKYCVIVINTIARQESCCHTRTKGRSF